MRHILVIGAAGQLGTELVEALRNKYGKDAVIATDIRDAEETNLEAPYFQLDVLDKRSLVEVVEDQKIDCIYHLAAVLSAKGEHDPMRAWEINMASLLNILELARTHGVRVYWPSSIAVFGPDTPKDHTPQFTVMNPNTVYGISKLAGERWCSYYHHKFGVDVRSIRYPGLIGYKALPGGGTTDYAVDIYHKALSQEPYTCFLKPDMTLPMMYMEDAVRGTIELMEAPVENISIWSSYNLAGMRFNPQEIYQEVLKHFPDFKMDFEADFRNEIADSWPNSINDSVAAKDWGWQPHFDLKRMTEDILKHLPQLINS
jgi:nucleoside-diphosphate-sugar epimerase